MSECRAYARESLERNPIGRSDRRAFDPHVWTGAAIANHSVISPVTALLESDVDDWTYMPAVTFIGRFVAVYRAGR